VKAGRDVSVWLVGAAGLFISVAIPLRSLLPASMDPSVFLALGRASPHQTAYATRLLGQVTVRPGLGHDGRFFFVQANDPWYLRPVETGMLLDRPLYRGQRMLYPMISGGFGFFPPRVIMWSMLATNVLAMTIGAIIATKLALSWGLPAWLGLLVPLNIGLLFEMEVGGAGVLAFVLCLAALLALQRDRTLSAFAFFAGAALTREVMILFAFGVFVVMWLSQRRQLWPIVVAPVVALGLWLAYLVPRLADVTGEGPSRAAFALPFLGLIDAIRSSWLRGPWIFSVNLALLVVVILFVPVTIRSRLPIAWGALPFAALAIVLSENVWRETFDLARAFAPIFTAAPFVVLYRDRANASAAQPGRQTDAPARAT
jgi:hypothetical protein